MISRNARFCITLSIYSITFKFYLFRSEFIVVEWNSQPKIKSRQCRYSTHMNCYCNNSHNKIESSSQKRKEVRFHSSENEKLIMCRNLLVKIDWEESRSKWNAKKCNPTFSKALKMILLDFNEDEMHNGRQPCLFVACH